MSRKTIFWILPLIFLLLSWSHNPIDSTKSVDEIKTANQLIQLVNDHRESLGKSKLIRNSLADQLAAEHVNYMISKKDVNNDNFEIRWEALEQQANAKDITENVGFDLSAEKAMNAYLSSHYVYFFVRFVIIYQHLNFLQVSKFLQHQLRHLHSMQ